MLTNILNYNHIIWDWNGTLLNDNWLCVDVINTLLKKRGMPLTTLNTYKEIFVFPVIEYYHKLGFEFTDESFEEVQVKRSCDDEDSSRGGAFRRRGVTGMRSECLLRTGEP